MAAGEMQFKLTKPEQERIREKIQEIESKAHTKIVLQIVRDHSGDLYKTAVKEFSKLHLRHEKIKTGILILISLKARQFQILGDQHIHEKIGEAGWKRLANSLSESFKENKFHQGLLDLLESLDESLTKHFQRTISNF